MLEELWAMFEPEVFAEKIAAFLPRLVSAVLIALAFWLFAIIVRRAAAAGLMKRMPAAAKDLLLRFIRYGIVILAVLTILDQLGVNVTSMIAGLGIAGLAISFAAQDTIANMISGISIIIDKPFKLGDWVEIDNVHACVDEIRLRTTVLTTFDNETMVMPNKDLTQARIINYTLVPRIRVRVAVGIAYKEDTEAARRVMLSTLQGDNRILQDPEPKVIVTGLGASSVNLELRFWTDDAIQKYPMYWEYTEKCKRALDEADIQIPFPHMQMFLEKSEGLEYLQQFAAGKQDE